MKTLIDVLDHSTSSNGTVAFVYSREREETYTYDQLRKKALTVLGYLQSCGIGPKDKLVFQFYNDYQFVHTFWACILGGIIAVPIACNDKSIFNYKFFKARETLGRSFFIAPDNRIEEIKKYAIQNDFDVDDLMKDAILSQEAFDCCNEGTVCESTSDDIAFIQFSSGSTNLPKGIVLRHRNLVANLDAITQRMQANQDDILPFWIPLTHDMGLIGCHLASIYINSKQIIIPTSLFIYKPKIWLEIITKHKATILVCNDFGLKFATKTMNKGKDTYDLSHIHSILNGAEPISISDCEAFLKKGSDYGLKSNVIRPAYGLAEATLAVSILDLGEELTSFSIDRSKLKIGQEVQFLPSRDELKAATYVTEGTAINDVQFRICDNNDILLLENHFGHVQITGVSVFDEYYNNPEETNASRTSDGWFKTGDLGFVNNDRIIIVGRTKDVVIINGQNFVSNDLERIACKADGILNGKIAITSVYSEKSDQEKVAAFVVCSNLNTFEKLNNNLKTQMMKYVGIMLDYVIPVKKIPKTSSGKLMRYELRAQFEKGTYTDILSEISKLRTADATAEKRDMMDFTSEEFSEIRRNVQNICADVFPDIDIIATEDLFQYGINSTLIVKLYDRLQQEYPRGVQIEDLFACKSPNDIAKKIYQTHYTLQQADISEKQSKNTNSQVAIIGMAALVPGAKDKEEFFDNLCEGTINIGSIPEKRHEQLQAYCSRKGKPEEYVIGGYLQDIDLFDNSFFNIINNEAIVMSPTQRLFLEVAYSAMEDGGYGGDILRSSNTGIYVGYIADMCTQQFQNIVEISEEAGTPTGVLAANISSRLAYYMDFQGPSMLVDTACSSSFAALEVACQSVSNGECDQAIVGGVQVSVLPMDDHRFGAESKTGKVSPFDDEADGLVEGEGVIAVLIKSYEQAIKDKDNIYAVIDAVHSNQDGRSVGLSAPNPTRQKLLIEHTLEKAGLTSLDIDYIEAHGTGTLIGDPIEMNVLSKLFPKSEAGNDKNCYVGALKSNIGHLYSASGLASLVKCCMIMKYKSIPPIINLNKLNEKIQMNNSRLAFNKQLVKWDYSDKLMHCSINNFGFSGTNVHAILKEHRPEDRVLENSSYPFMLSANTNEQLLILLEKIKEYLQSKRSEHIADICFTLSKGRASRRYRFATAVSSTEELIAKIQNFSGYTDIANSIFTGNISVRENSIGLRWNEITKETQQILSEKVIDISKSFGAQDLQNRLKLCERIGQLYVDGALPQVGEIFSGIPVRTVSLPTYPFMKKSFWPYIK